MHRVHILYFYFFSFKGIATEAQTLINSGT